MSREKFSDENKKDSGLEPENKTPSSEHLNENAESGEYSFMNQVIREKPKNHRKLIHRAAAVIVTGVLIGAVAAFSYVACLPIAEKVLGKEAETERVSIPSDDDPNEISEAAMRSESENIETGSASAENSVSAVSESSAVSTSAESIISTESGSEQAEGQSEVVSEGTEGEEGTVSGTTDESNGTVSEATDESNGTVSDGTIEQNADSSDENTGIDLTETGTDVDAADEENADETEDVEEESAYWGRSDITVYDYKLLYQDMMTMAEEPMQSIVIVTGITNELDYFNQNYIDTTRVSGLVIAESGENLYILTEYQSIADVEQIQITFYDATVADAVFVKQDTNTGLCVLQVAKDDLMTEIPVANLGNSYTVQKGEPVLALGSPMGYSDAVAFGTVTSVTNKISLLDCEYNILTTDIEGSDYGSGVLINLNGQVVGFVSQGLRSGSSMTVTGYAISQIKELIQTLSNNESIPYIGISGQNVTSDIAERAEMPVGILVTEVAADSPAMLSGLKEYDVIVAISGSEVTTMRDYQKFLRNRTSGEVVTVTAMRKGAEGYSEVRFSVAVSER